MRVLPLDFSSARHSLPPHPAQSAAALRFCFSLCRFSSRDQGQKSLRQLLIREYRSEFLFWKTTFQSFPAHSSLFFRRDITSRSQTQASLFGPADSALPKWF